MAAQTPPTLAQLRARRETARAAYLFGPDARSRATADDYREASDAVHIALDFIERYQALHELPQRQPARQP